MIVDCGVYRDGVREQGSREVAGTRQRIGPDDGFAWIGLHDPTPEEFAVASQEFDLHELLVEDALKAHQRAKIERYGNVAFVVLKTARYVAPDKASVGEIQLILGPHFVIAIRHGDATPLSGVRQRLESTPELLALGPAAVLYTVADQIVDDYAPMIAELELDVDEAEQEVFSGGRANPAERIFGLKRAVLDLLRNLLPVADVLDDLQEPDSVVAGDTLHAYFRDVGDHLRRHLGRLELVRDLLSDALNANLAQVSVRQNDDMRTISAWAALIAAPTMLAGVWGMNFTNMPELDWWFGYPVALGSMVVVVLLLWRNFKRSGWL